MIKTIGIYRETKLAGNPGADQRIIDLTAKELEKKDFEISIKKPEDFSSAEEVALVFNMARDKGINELLSEKENSGVFVINSPEAIRFSFNRKLTYQKMKEVGANIPETKIIKTEEIKFSDLGRKSILKPANRHEFWFIVENEDDFSKAIEEYRKNNIEEIVIQKFVEGKHVKYYVTGKEVVLPKGIEEENSAKTIEEIKRQALLTGQLTGLKIFGGDFIIGEGIPFCVDANDWPSMGSIEGFTQEEAAVKIADLIEEEYNNFKNN